MLTRRQLFQAIGATALLPAAAHARQAPASARAFRMPVEGPDTPKICLGFYGTVDEAGMRRVRQIGVDYVLTGGPAIPWDETGVRERMERFKAGGLSLCNMMISGFNDVILGRPGADARTQDVIASIRAAGRAGLPVIEYNFYANRLMEGYKEEAGRAGAGYTAYDYELSRSLPPREDVGTHTRAAQLERAERFLKAIVPEAEKANVRLALHPNDPPVPTSRGSEQLMATFEHWKEYLNLVRSPYNGMTFDCGVTRELGEDPVAVCRYLGERDVINHVHFRNVVVRKPYVDYTEVFPDEGQVDMFAVMRELVRQKYPRWIYPEHPRAIDVDRERGSIRSQYPGGGGFAGEIYNVAYTRAMLQAALSR
ncbi:MAG TPA: mannonate dehydratase [Vicinamibacterales bacterium]|nr:mannonate dehydratase [Vicinamibacterales bacterium]